MRDFYAATAPAPLDQADGLRRLFGGQRQRVLPLAANPYVAAAGTVLDHVAAGLVARGQKVLVVDAADRSPLPSEMALIDLAACVEVLSPDVGYLAARGLPLAHVDTRGSAAGFVDALLQCAPQADVILLHANATDLARMFMRRAARPMLLGSDDADSIKHAYAACKLLAQRCSLMTFDLLLAARRRSRRAPTIASTLANTADGFLGAVLHDWAVIDPSVVPGDSPDPALDRLLAAQLAFQPDAYAPAYMAAASARHHATTN